MRRFSVFCMILLGGAFLSPSLLHAQYNKKEAPTPPPEHHSEPASEHHSYSPPSEEHRSTSRSSNDEDDSRSVQHRSYSNSDNSRGESDHSNSSGGATHSYAPAPHPVTPPRTYSPGNAATPATGSTNSATRTYVPGSASNSAVHTYTPGRAQPAATPEPSVHTYTPNANRSPAPTRSTAPSDTGVTSANGVTTYTPQAHTVSSGNYTFAPKNFHSSSDAFSHPSSGPSSSRVGASSPSGSTSLSATHSTVSQLNATRASLQGLNAKPLPVGQLTSRPNGGYILKTASGRQYGLRTNGSIATYKAGPKSATFHANGKIASLHTSNLDVVLGPRGNRTVIVRGPNHSIVVSRGKNAGYVQHAIVHNGRTLFQRTSFSGAHSWTSTYVPYSYHGVALASYQPAVVFDPDYYGWAYYPWAVPVTYSWLGNPYWFGFYSAFFAADPTYGSPADWLANYLLGMTIGDGTDQGVDPNAQQDGSDQPQPDDDAPQAEQTAPDDSTNAQDQPQDSQDGGGDTVAAPADAPITAELKQAIVTEVQQQIGYENAAQQQPDQATTLADLPQIMQANHLFVVDQSIHAGTTAMNYCYLGAGDVVSLNAAPGAQDTQATLTVTASRRKECPKGTQVILDLSALQDMQNNFRERLNDGLVTLNTQQGTKGLPSAPPSVKAKPPKPNPNQPPVTSTNVASAKAQVKFAQKQATVEEADLVASAVPATHLKGEL